MSSMTVPVEFNDPINARILAVSEDQLQGFQCDPFGEIARLSGVERPVVIERIQAMQRAGNIRRVRQTLLATNLAQGALVAWQVPEMKLNAAFDWMFQQDPFSGHVVTRSTDAATPGSAYRLWTTLKVPQGFSMARHCQLLCQRTGAWPRSSRSRTGSARTGATHRVPASDCRSRTWRRSSATRRKRSSKAS